MCLQSNKHPLSRLCHHLVFLACFFKTNVSNENLQEKKGPFNILIAFK